MSEQPSPTGSTSSSPAALLPATLSEHSTSSMDSLGGESCDDLDTMLVPDAVVQDSPSKQIKETESVDGAPEESELELRKLAAYILPVIVLYSMHA